MVKILDVVVLTRSFPEYGLLPGDVGVVADVWRGGDLLEVEFATAKGETVALLTLAPEDVRLVAANEIYQVRELTKKAT